MVIPKFSVNQNVVTRKETTGRIVTLFVEAVDRENILYLCNDGLWYEEFDLDFYMEW